MSAAGLERLYRGQHYRLIDEEPHVCRDGRHTLLGLWESECAECGEPFLFHIPLRAKRFQPNRRCQRHKRPGARVKGALE